MFGGFLGNVIGGVANALPGFFFRRAENDRVFSQNQGLSWSMWNAANAYNDPSAQMARFKRAGLNPNLIYGQMSNVGQPAVVHNQPAHFDWQSLLVDQAENLRKDLDVKDSNMAATAAGIRASDAATALSSVNQAAILQKMKNDQRAADDSHNLARVAYNQALVDLGMARGQSAFWSGVGGLFGYDGDPGAVKTAASTAPGFFGGVRSLLKRAVDFVGPGKTKLFRFLR